MTSVAVPVDVFSGPANRPMYHGIAGGKIPPPTFPAGTHWWVSPTKHIGTSDPMSATSFLALVEWLEKHAVPAIDLMQSGLAVQGTWLRAFSRLNALRELKIYGKIDLLTYLPVLPALRTLEVSSVKVTDDTVSALLHCSHLQSLTLSEMTPLAFERLGDLPDLRHLTVRRGSNIPVTALATLHAIRSLHLPSAELADAWDALADLPFLRELTVETIAPGRSKRPLAHIHTFTTGRLTSDTTLQLMPRLRHLTAQGWKDDDVAHLVGLTFDEVSFSNGTLGAYACKVLGGLMTLRGLHFGIGWGPDLSPLAPLRQLLQLERLTLPAACGPDDLAVVSELRTLKSLKIGENYTLRAKVFPSFFALSLLEKLIIEAPRLTDKGLEGIGAFINLRQLSLRGCAKLTDAMIPALQSLHQLEDLDVYDTGITRAGVRALPCFPHLRHLKHGLTFDQPEGLPRMPVDVHDCLWRIPTANVTVAYLRDVANMPFPPYLSFEIPLTEATAAALEGSAVPAMDLVDQPTLGHHLTTWPSLWYLTAANLDEAGCRNLGSVPLLTHLLITQDTHAQELAESLAEATSLRVIECSGNAITDATMAALARLPSLVRISFDGCQQVTDAGFAALAAIPFLTQLTIRRCSQVGDDTVAALGHHRHLVDLYIERGQLTGSGFANWTEHSPLESLQLEGTEKVTSATFVHFERLPKLKSVKIHDGPLLRDTIWESVLRIPSLQSIMVYRCPGLTYAAVTAAEQVLSSRGHSHSIYHDIPRKVAAPKVISRVREKKRKSTWTKNRPFKAEVPGALNHEIVHHLERLGARKGAEPSNASHLALPLRAFASYTWPENVTFANSEDSDQHVWGMTFQFEPDHDFADLLCLEGREFISIAMIDDGSYLLLMPVDSEMAEDPPVYLVDHEYYDNEDAELLSPMALSEMLAGLQVDTVDKDDA